MGKSNLSEALRVVTVEVMLVGPGADAALSDTDLQALCVASDGVRLAAKITDMPCAEMHTDAFLQVGSLLPFLLVCCTFGIKLVTGHNNNNNNN